jgi:hypothetical protein
VPDPWSQRVSAATNCHGLKMCPILLFRRYEIWALLGYHSTLISQKNADCMDQSCPISLPRRAWGSYITSVNRFWHSIQFAIEHLNVMLHNSGNKLWTILFYWERCFSIDRLSGANNYVSLLSINYMKSVDVPSFTCHFHLAQLVWTWFQSVTGEER